MFECPPDLSYSHRHMWAKTDEEQMIATIGIAEDLVEGMDEIFSIDMPFAGDELEMDHMCIHVHLQNEITHLRSPLTGRVTEINKDVLDRPNLLHVAPFVNWLYRMEFDEPEELELLMSPAQYLRHLDTDHL